MAKSVHDDVLDAALGHLADNGDGYNLCAGEPADFTAATGANQLGSTTLTAGDGNGDYTIANGDTSGRKVTVAAQSSITIDTSGTADHVAITDSGTSTLLYVTSLSSSQSVTSGNTADTEAFDVEIADPS